MSRFAKLLGAGTRDGNNVSVMAVASRSRTDTSTVTAVKPSAPSAKGKEKQETIEEETPVSTHKLIRAPRTQGTKFNVMKFREGSEVSLHNLVEPVSLIQDDEDDDERLEESYALKGKGAEFGKAEKDAQRRKKYQPRKNKKKAAPTYQLKDSGRTHLTGEVQENLKGKYFLIEAIEDGVFQIRPVDNYWEFRKFRTNRNVTLEMAEAEMAKPKARTDRFFKKDMRQETMESKKNAAGMKLVEGGEGNEVKEETDKQKSRKPKAKKVATTRNVDAGAEPDIEDVDNADEEFYAADSDEDIGVRNTTTGGVFKMVGNSLVAADEEVMSSESEEELERVANVKRSRNADDDDEDSEDEDEEEEEENENEDESKMDVDQQGLWGVKNSTSPEKGKSKEKEGAKDDVAADIGSVRKRSDENQDNPPDIKKRKVEVVAPALPQSVSGLAQSVKDAIKTDIEKYLNRAGAHGLPVKDLWKKLKKQPYYKNQGSGHLDSVKREILGLLPRVSQQKKIEGEQRLVHKTQLKKKTKS